MRKPLIDSIFMENPAGLAKMSVGHRKVAEESRQFAKLKGYYVGMNGRMWQNWRARLIGTGFNWAGIPENYRHILPDQHAGAARQQRSHMDYVATIFIE